MKLHSKLRKRLVKAADNLHGVVGWFEADVKCRLRESKEAETRIEEEQAIMNARHSKKLADQTRAAIRAIADVLGNSR